MWNRTPTGKADLGFGPYPTVDPEARHGHKTRTLGIEGSASSPWSQRYRCYSTPSDSAAVVDRRSF